MKTWHAVITDDPMGDPEHPIDPPDWKFDLELRDETGFCHEIIYVTFTGLYADGDDEEVVPQPEELVSDRIDAMLKGLSSQAKKEGKTKK